MSFRYRELLEYARKECDGESLDEDLRNRIYEEIDGSGKDSGEDSPQEVPPEKEDSGNEGQEKILPEEDPSSSLWDLLEKTGTEISI